MATSKRRSSTPTRRSAAASARTTARPTPRPASKAKPVKATTPKKATAPKARTRVRAALESATPPVPRASALAEYIGVPLAAPLKPDQARRLLKPLPGYRAIMDNVIDLLREDNDILELDHDPDEVEERLAHAKDLASRNSILQEVLAGSDGQRQLEDSFLMKVLLNCVKRVGEETRVHPELKPRWQEVLEFVRKNRPGRGGAKRPTEPPADESADDTAM